MTGEFMAVFLHPHKSFEKIKEEYGVDWSENELRKLADLMTEGKRKEVFEFLCELGEKYGLKGRRLGSFVYDVLRTAIFYMQALEALKNVLEDEEER